MSHKQDDAIIERVLAAYASRYPKWTNVKVTSIADNKHVGTMVSVMCDQYPEGEICIVADGRVNIFGSTPDLVRWLDMRTSRIVSVRDWVMLIVVLVMLALFGVLVVSFQNDQAISMVVTAVSGILGTYAGIKIQSQAEKSG
ncbi:MAG TPA: hypothetical protein VFQ45_21860 [Longimicrobium sp.]|nr:hypothetical protein [Longimicrobium sp.]